MSCGGLHELHVHDTDDSGWPDPAALGAEPDDAEPAAPGPDETGAEAAGGGAHARPKKPSRVKIWFRGAWDRNGYRVKPFAIWVPGVDGSAWVMHEIAAHQVFGADPWTVLATVAGVGVTAEIVTEIKNHKAKRSDRWKTVIRRQITVATTWSMLASALTPTGWLDLVQWAALAGGSALAGVYVHEVTKARREARPPEAPPLEPPQPPLQLAAPEPVDPRQIMFTDRFCQPGGLLDGAIAEHFRNLPRGFMFEIVFLPDSRHSMSDVEGMRVLIAKMYTAGLGIGITADDVEVGYVPDNRSELRCQVTVQTRAVITTAERENPTYNRWNGKSTYDPVRGTFGLGLFTDQNVGHYHVHEPGSGAKMGLVTGVPGSGKTTTLHILGCEAGLAKLCSQCGPRGDCGPCDPQRVMAVWMADMQAQGMGLWRNRADVTGWGPEGAVEMAECLEEISRVRGEQASEEEWWDIDAVTGLERRNVGRGWFDLAVGNPLIFAIFDEWPWLVQHPDKDLVRAGLRVIANGLLTWRKRGIHVAFGTGSLDIDFLGIKEIRELISYINSVAHRTDKVSATMAGVTGDPRTLPIDAVAAAFLNGLDGRPRERADVKFIRETNRPGMTGADIRHVAGIIERTPLLYDRASQAVLDAWDIAPRQVLTEWRGRAGYGQQAAAPDPAAAGPLLSVVPTLTATAAADRAAAGPAATGPGIGGLAYREDAEKVLEAVTGRPGGDIADVMEATGLSLGAVAAALDALAANGKITRQGEKYYAAA
jgi:hypothetical protein